MDNKYEVRTIELSSALRTALKYLFKFGNISESDILTYFIKDYPNYYIIIIDPMDSWIKEIKPDNSITKEEFYQMLINELPFCGQCGGIIHFGNVIIRFQYEDKEIKVNNIIELKKDLDTLYGYFFY